MSSAPMEVSPLRGLCFDLDRLSKITGGAPLVTSPPYDVISPAEHQELLDACEFNIVRLTLGDDPGANLSGSGPSYEARAALLERWVEEGVLRAEPEPCFYVYEIEYSVPGTGERRRMLGFTGLGRLHPFEDRVILPHEETFPKVVADRQALLAATRANLESIALLYSDPAGEIDALLEEAAVGEPAVRVEARAGEFHSLYPIRDARLGQALTEKMRAQKPLIADGHHRYTTSLRYHEESAGSGESVPGSEWQMMTFTNLFNDGLTILATHRLLSLRDGAPVGAVLACLDEKLEIAGDDDWHLRVETVDETRSYRVPSAVREGFSGVGRTDYVLLRDLIIAEWLSEWTDDDPAVAYFKEGTGEAEALRRGDGHVLFRMRPVDRSEFQVVIEGGEVFPHKTTYFYPKLWSGLVVWSLEDPSRAASR